jgi:outer membrane receptor for ferrienterochelin and colicin
VKSVGHSTISPRLRVAFPVTENTNFRLSYSHQVQTPEFTTLLTGVNNDLDFTNTNDVFGRDLQFGKSILFEFGVRHAFSQDMVLDISAYNKDKVSDYAARIVPFADPANCQAGACDTTNLNVLTNSDFGNVRGVDVKLDRRVGNYLNASVSYTFQLSKSTGSDPFSYIRTTSRQGGSHRQIREVITLRKAGKRVFGRGLFAHTSTVCAARVAVDLRRRTDRAHLVDEQPVAPGLQRGRNSLRRNTDQSGQHRRRKRASVPRTRAPRQ